MSSSSAARTNLTSTDVSISNIVLGTGAFRVTLLGTYRGGNRNDQEAACKRFKPEYRAIQDEFFAMDFKVIDTAIQLAEEWNRWCPSGKEILITRGSFQNSRSGIKYLIEPLIRYYTKFTSNTGWIASHEELGWPVQAMEAFSHYTYHCTNGKLIVCDLQGRHRQNKFKPSTSRFELTDPAICSRTRLYGPTDMGEKGIETFFCSHKCNEFCSADWDRPRNPTRWFSPSSQTSMISSKVQRSLQLTNKAKFKPGLTSVMEPYYSDSDSDSW